MRASRHAAIRQTLRKHADGMSVSQISRQLGGDLNEDTVRRSLSVMPDVYVDRWERGINSKYRAVYCAVNVPDNCPHPNKS